MPPIILCPKSESQEQGKEDISSDKTGKQEAAPQLDLPQNAISNTTKDFPDNVTFSDSWDHNITGMLTGLNVEQSIIDGLRISTHIPSKFLVLPILKPLEKSVLVIVWELFCYPSSQSILSTWTNIQGGSVGGFVRLIRSAATYEADVHNVSIGVASHRVSCTDVITEWSHIKVNNVLA